MLSKFTIYALTLLASSYVNFPTTQYTAKTITAELLHEYGKIACHVVLVLEENLSGRKFTHFPRKFCPNGQDILFIPGPGICLQC